MQNIRITRRAAVLGAVAAAVALKLPVAVSAQDDQAWAKDINVVRAISRQFAFEGIATPVGGGLQIPVFVGWAVYQFETPEIIEGSFKQIVDAWEVEVKPLFEGSTVQVPLVDDFLVGDELVAIVRANEAGEPAELNTEGPNTVIIFMRSGAYLHQGFVIVDRADAEEISWTIASMLVERAETDEAEAVDDVGYHTGGMWNLLPTKEDVDPMTFVEDQDGAVEGKVTFADYIYSKDEATPTA